MWKFTSSVIRCRKGVERAARGVEEVGEEWGANTGRTEWTNTVTMGGDSKEKKGEGHFLTYKVYSHFEFCEKQCGGGLRIATLCK